MERLIHRRPASAEFSPAPLLTSDEEVGAVEGKVRVVEALRTRNEHTLDRLMTN